MFQSSLSMFPLRKASPIKWKRRSLIISSNWWCRIVYNQVYRCLKEETGISILLLNLLKSDYWDLCRVHKVEIWNRRSLMINKCKLFTIKSINVSKRDVDFYLLLLLKSDCCDFVVNCIFLSHEWY